MTISEIKKIVDSNEWLMTIPASTCEAKIDIIINKSHLMPKVDLMKRWGWTRDRVRWLLNRFPSNKKDKKSKELTEPIKSFKETYGLEHIVKIKLTENDYEKLVNRYGVGVVHSKIIALEGSVHINKKVNHYATLVNWIQRENGKNKQQNSSYKDQAHLSFYSAVKGKVNGI